MVKQFTFDRNDAIELVGKMLNKMKNIHKDEKGYFFYGGTKVNLLTEGGNDIEDKHNLEIVDIFNNDATFLYLNGNVFR